MIAFSEQPCFSSLLPADDRDSLQVEMSGLLKELHCPSEELVSGLLKGRLLKARHHLQFLRTSSLLQSGAFRTSAPLSPPNVNSLTFSHFPPSVPQLRAPGGSDHPVQARRQHAGQQSGPPRAPGDVLHSEPTGSSGTGRCGSFISRQRGGKERMTGA